MLVPILEVLREGYDVIYFDIDIAMLQDPIPIMMQGNAEFTVSLETRSCLCPSVKDVALRTKWKDLEPNTGIMRVRSTPTAIDIFTNW